ncbi:MAG: hypothetical protein FWD77_01480 [Betaproteobacteria bacterium]|nr:hypothetical protein [Betaproteobacteria bacterium]
MQKDMHYAGTYAMAVAAGIPARDAVVIATASQYVDDSTWHDSQAHPDGGRLSVVTTAHHPAQSLIRTSRDEGCGFEEQRKIWIPFHFFPGGAGDCFEERLLCVKDGPLVREMLENHLEVAAEKPYGLELIGICAHVYADTFSHYGFSGMTSDFNKVKKGSFLFLEEPEPGIKKYILGKTDRFLCSSANNLALGHGSVATMPDRPYVHWGFEFEQRRPGNGALSHRDNPADYLEACKKLHSFFCRFAKRRYENSTQTAFESIRDAVRSIIAFEGTEEERCSKWGKSGLTPGIPAYDSRLWELEKKFFHERANSQAGIDSAVYRFHQAAAYHRTYVLKDLLPGHGMAVT